MPAIKVSNGLYFVRACFVKKKKKRMLTNEIRTHRICIMSDLQPVLPRNIIDDIFKTTRCD